jgi:hypothetical protein
VAPYFRKELTAKAAEDRRSAALGLLDLQEYGPAAHALSDADGAVRMAVACQMVASSRPGAE